MGTTRIHSDGLENNRMHLPAVADSSHLQALRLRVLHLLGDLPVHSLLNTIPGPRVPLPLPET